MNALPIMIGAVCILALGYRYYSAFIAARVLALDPDRPTAAHLYRDGQNFHPTNRWVLFGHHFAAISGAGPLIGPVLAAQFGFAPGLLWLLIGVTLGGAVHDFIVLTASTRRGGRSLAEIARQEVGPVAGWVCGIAILFIVIVALAGLGLVVVQALAESPWGTFTVGLTIPMALLMGCWIYRIRPGDIRGATIAGVIGLLFAVWAGGWIAESSWASYFTFDATTLTWVIALYGFVASVLPVWLLLCPRDYLSSTMKIGTVVGLVLVVVFVAPKLRMPAITPFAEGGGPIIPGTLWPFVFTTIACGAISGFHSLIASGTTPKMLDRETDARMIGYGGMLIEGLVAVTALIAAASLCPGDYFAINIDQKTDEARARYERFVAGHHSDEFPLQVCDLPELERATGEAHLRGRTGGGVTLAVGIADIISALPGMSGMVKYWYHFAIMFEALFILTTIDTGTRVARFLLGEFLGRFHSKLGRHDWKPGAMLTSAVIVVCFALFIQFGTISTIWPIFGIANQLLAGIALAVCTTVLVNEGRRRYIWVTLLPLSFVAITTLSAGYLSITDNFLKLTENPNTAMRGWINAGLTAVMMTAMVIILVSSIPRWWGRPAAPLPR
jgi:carbon starvation protein